jgi:hypothetical protein
LREPGLPGFADVERYSADLAGLRYSLKDVFRSTGRRRVIFFFAIFAEECQDVDAENARASKKNVIGNCTK